MLLNILWRTGRQPPQQRFPHPHVRAAPCVMEFWSFPFTLLHQLPGPCPPGPSDKGLVLMIKEPEEGT